jgi:two-component system cell cycle sensor histidine kinase/response regulator CckA
MSLLPPLPTEKERLQALARYEILDSISEAEFDDITWLASHLCGAPIALISLIDSDRQWYKSNYGIAATETSLDVSFCVHAIRQDEVFEVSNTLQDDRFKDNPFVTGGPELRFYAGAPLKTPDGHNIGTICVADMNPRKLTDEHREALSRLSRQVICLMESRLAQKQLERINLEERKSSMEKDRWAATLLSNLKGMIFRSTGIENMVFEFVSEGCRSLLGVDPVEIMSQRIKYTDLIHPEDKERVLAYRAAMIKGRRPLDLEYRLILPDGQIKWIWVRALSVFSPEGTFVCVEGIITDITQRKEMEANLLRAERMESIGTLAGGIAHDLNNLLSPIMIGTDLLKHFGISGPSLKVVEDIQRSTKRGASLVQQVLSFARGEEGARISVHIGDVINEITSIVKSTFPKNITLTTKVASDLWLILSDPTQLSQILLNLCVNARDALPSGGVLSITANNIVIDSSVDPKMQGKISPGRYVGVEVADTGTGIPKDKIDRIFEPFFTTKELGKGTGLGLATVLGIVRSHGGHVDVSSEEGRGTTFRIFLPAGRSELVAPLVGVGDEDHPRGNGELILVVDDETSILEMTERTLSAYGYTVVTAENGAQALSIFTAQQDKIAAVMTDMMMPVMDGPSMIAAMQGIRPDVRVIASCGLEVDDLLTQASSLGVKDFLTKPYTTAALLQALRGILSGQAPA